MRDKRIDGLKSILIFLVVLGHLDITGGAYIGKLIYSFHMPMFVFLSGYLTSFKNDNRTKIKKLKQLLLIYFVAQFAHVVLESIINQISITDLKYQVFRFLTTPCFSLWYLLCLIYWRFAVWFCFKNVSDKTLFVLSAFLALLSGFIHIEPDLCAKRALAFFPYFVLGIFCRKYSFSDRIFSMKHSLPIAVLVFCVGLFCAGFLPIYIPKAPYHHWYGMLLRAGQTLLAIVICIAFFRISMLDFFNKISGFGRKSLWIYIGQSFLIIIGNAYTSTRQFVSGLSFPIAILFALTYCFLFFLLGTMNEYKNNKIKN